MRKTTRLKQLIEAPEILLMAGVHDALGARLAEQAGFSSLCLGGYGASASLLGMPDVGLLTQTEMADQVRRVADCVQVPVFVDGDTGHGGAPSAARTVRAFEQAGAAGMFLEDQVFPKRCGHMEGKDVVAPDEMLAKLAAALDARTDPDFVIMARTDAIAVNGLDDALKRGRMYAEAGADMVFVEAPTDENMLRAITKNIPAPSFGVYLEGGKIPQLSAAEFEEMGFAVLAFACSSVYATAFALRETFAEIMRTGATRQSVARMTPFAEFNELLGLSALREWEKSMAEKNRD